MKEQLYGIKLAENNQMLEFKQISEDDTQQFELVFRVKEYPDSYGNGIFDIEMVKIRENLLGGLKIMKINGSWAWDPRTANTVICDTLGNKKTFTTKGYKCPLEKVYRDIFSQIMCECCGVENFELQKLIEDGQNSLNLEGNEAKQGIISFFKEYKNLTMQSKMWNDCSSDTRARISSIADKLLSKLETL